MIKQYFYNILLTIDQSFNTILLFGDPDVSISSHLALAQYLDQKGLAKKKWFVDPFAKFVDYLFSNPLYTITRHHIKSSIELDELNHKALWKWYTPIKKDLKY